MKDLLTGDIVSFFDTWAPFSSQNEWDNSGLIVGHPHATVSAALICLECTEEVLEEAQSLSASLIICHHPLLLKPVRHLRHDDYGTRLFAKAIRMGIAVLAVHTNLDRAENGVSHEMARKLGLVAISPLDLDGTGVSGMLENEMKPGEFLQIVALRLNTLLIRSTLSARAIRKVACCGGSGSFLLERAIEMECDALVTSDFKYHRFFDGLGRILITDVGHYESEQFTPMLMFGKLSSAFPTFAFYLSRLNTNPVVYHFYGNNSRTETESFVRFTDNSHPHRQNTDSEGGASDGSERS